MPDTTPTVDVVPIDTAPSRAARQPVVPRPGLDPIRGPSALGDDPRRLLRLTWTLALTDFRLRFFGSALGYLWQFMQPLMLFGVLYAVWGVLLKSGGPEKYYAVALLAGIVMYTFIGEATSQSVRSIVNREPLVRKIEFPRAAVPLSTVLTALMNFGLNLLPVVLFLIAAGGRPRVSWLETPVIVLLLTSWILGLSLLLSALFVRYRDVDPIWTVVMQILFYATPIFYTLQTVQDKSGEQWVGQLLMCNPFAAALQQFRHSFIDPSHQSAAQAMGGDLWVLIPIAISLVTLALGAVVFGRMAPRVAEEL
jgi:ABC-2 type transport system permease protein